MRVYLTQYKKILNMKIDETTYASLVQENYQLVLHSEFDKKRWNTKDNYFTQKHPMFSYFYKLSPCKAMPKILPYNKKTEKSLIYKMSTLSMHHFKKTRVHIQNCKDLKLYMFAWLEEQELFHEINRILLKAYSLNLDKKLNKAIRKIYLYVKKAEHTKSWIHFEFVCFLIAEAFTKLHEIAGKKYGKQIKNRKARKKAINFANYKKRTRRK